MIRLAIVGLGHVAGYQMTALQSSEGLKLCALCDLNEEKRSLAGNIPFYASMDDVLRQEEVDAVIVSTPHAPHYPLVLQALDAGKHVLLEKPATANAQELEKLVAHARRRSLSLVVALHAAFGKETEWFAKQYRQSMRQSNPIASFSCHFSDPYLRDGELTHRGRTLGGSWIDSSINALSILDCLLDRSTLRFDDFSASYSDSPQASAADVNAYAGLNFMVSDSETTGSGSIRTHWDLNQDLKMTELSFVNGAPRILLHHSKQQVLALTDDEEPKVLADFSAQGDRLVNHYRGVLLDFAGHVERSSDNTLQAQALLELALLPLQRISI